MNWTQRGLRKVPEVTIFFWVIKILTTAMGEATSDYSVHAIDPVIAVCLGFIAFVIAMSLQLRTDRYKAPIYWLAVVMVAVFGTMCADVLHVRFKVPYEASTTGFAIVLAAVFFTWYKVEGTLSIHSIFTLRRELFYWAAILATFAMGTALGDLTAYVLHLGFFSSALLFTVLFAIPGLAYRFAGLNGVLAFLDRLCPHPAHGRFLCRLAGRSGEPRGPRVGTGDGRCHFHHPHRHLGRVPHREQGGSPGGPARAWRRRRAGHRAVLARPAPPEASTTVSLSPETLFLQDRHDRVSVRRVKSLQGQDDLGFVDGHRSTGAPVFHRQQVEPEAPKGAGERSERTGLVGQDDTDHEVAAGRREPVLDQTGEQQRVDVAARNQQYDGPSPGTAPASRAASGTAPAGSTTHLHRSRSSTTARLISSSSTVTTSSTSALVCS